MQKTLFCNVYFAELSENRIKAQLYGKWLGGFDKNIKEGNLSRWLCAKERKEYMGKPYHFYYLNERDRERFATNTESRVDRTVGLFQQFNGFFFGNLLEF
ncbi:hypothetical protein Murru_0448 [Allomuricauda ruestringensis DSM 13258]|uniref:Uncharacterized protein n=1 Tax=Allomuricauda ruestringensis (strain DSM 13258 / CIP 107369 / LMG 19739 / B1) TaxID=886377 RepID=G2PRQ3_ALLRU|nr:hypothetical protein Murru_0448 [Allomuricauda ruestringensis DSM 13258]